MECQPSYVSERTKPPTCYTRLKFKRRTRGALATCHFHKHQKTRDRCQTFWYERLTDAGVYEKRVAHYTFLTRCNFNYRMVPYSDQWFYELCHIETDHSTYLTTQQPVMAIRGVSPHLMSIERAGEGDFESRKLVFKATSLALDAVDDKWTVLFKNRLFVDLLYAPDSIVFLPNEMYLLPDTTHVDEEGGDDDGEGIGYTLFQLPVSDEARECQLYYKFFVLYNTMLTLMLRESSPFNLHNNVPSLIIKRAGKCPANVRNVKCCTLDYTRAPPDHMMCIPIKFVERVMYYNKWATSDRPAATYKRYHTALIRKPGRSVDDDAWARERLAWAGFINAFFKYFG